MSFATEWALAIHRAVWFPVLWLTGLEAPAIEAPFPNGPPSSATCPPGSCPAARSTGKYRPHMRPTRAVRKAKSAASARDGRH